MGTTVSIPSSSALSRWLHACTLKQRDTREDLHNTEEMQQLKNNSSYVSFLRDAIIAPAPPTTWLLLHVLLAKSHRWKEARPCVLPFLSLSNKAKASLISLFCASIQWSSCATAMLPPPTCFCDSYERVPPLPLSSTYYCM